MRPSSDWLARKIGYGFGSSETLPALDISIERAKAHVRTVPPFDPWRFVAENAQANTLAAMGLPKALTNLAEWALAVADLRSPDDLPRAVEHIRASAATRDALRLQQGKGLISQQEFNRRWWKRYNQFP